MDAPLEKPALAPAEQDSRWRRVASRDRSADGAFFYSVETTGVYCRPSCAARRPNRANVRFHASAADAEEAGFRPCRRCRPDAAPLTERYAAMVSDACRRIEAAAEPPNSGGAGQGRGPQRLSFSPRLQGDRRRDAPGIRRRASRPARAGSIDDER